MAAITYEELQNRIDYLQKTEYATANAFYPTRFVKAGDVSAITEQVNFRQRIIDPSIGPKKLIPLTTLPKLLEAESDNNLGSNILNNDSDLALLKKVNGEILKFMDIPYSSKGGVIDTGVTSSEGALKPQKREVTLTFKVPNDFSVYNKLLEWKENWASSSLTYRYLKKRSGTNAVQEGYLGLSYVNIKYDGNIEAKAHLSLFGLIPISVNFTKSIGPGENTSTWDVEIKCTVASGLFITPGVNGLNVFPLV